MSCWDFVNFGQLFAEPVRNGVYKSAEFQGTGINIVNMKELFGFEFIGDQPMRKIELSNEEKQKFLLKNGDLLFARRSIVEEGSGKTSIIKGLTQELTFESSIIRVRLNLSKAYPLFYYYYLFSSVGKPSITALSSGVTVKGIRGSDLKKVKIPLPPLPIQQKIATILCSYDDLIENNLKRIKLLEEMAQITYEEWFVRLKFPGYETTLIDKEIILKSKNEDLSDILYISVEKYLEIAKTFGIPKSGDILITAVGTLGFPYLINDRDGKFYFKDGNLIWLRDFKSTKYVSYFICVFKSKKFQNELESIAIGSSQKALTIQGLKNLNVLIPSNQVIDDFNKVIIPVLKIVETLLAENQLLKEARDILLPRLMTGMIDVEQLILPELFSDTPSSSPEQEPQTA